MSIITSISTCILLSIVNFIPAFLFGYALFGVFKEFDIISCSTQISYSIVVAIGFAVVTLIVKLIRLIRKKSAKIEIWFSLNHAKIWLGYVIVVIILFSIKSEIICTLGDLKEFISLQWMIFGISITIFLVWNILITDYLKKNIPFESKNDSLLGELKYINIKSDFYVNATTRFISVTVLVINLIVLLYATASVYLTMDSNDGVNLFNQNISKVSFYLCTNTLASLFFDILLPLAKEKKDIFKKSKPTNEEVEKYIKSNQEIVKALKEVELINKITTLSEKEKAVLSAKVLYKITGQPFLLDIIKNETNEESSVLDTYLSYLNEKNDEDNDKK